MNFKDAWLAHLNGEAVQCMSIAWKHGAPASPRCVATWRDFGDYYADVTYAEMLVECDAPVQLRLRVKPRIVMCNGVEVPAPESVAPVQGTVYYTPHVTREPGYNEETWDRASFDLRVLEQGLVYLNKEDAIARTKAMLITC